MMMMKTMIGNLRIDWVIEDHLEQPSTVVVVVSKEDWKERLKRQKPTMQREHRGKEPPEGLDYKRQCDDASFLFHFGVEINNNVKYPTTHLFSLDQVFIQVRWKKCLAGELRADT